MNYSILLKINYAYMCVCVLYYLESFTAALYDTTPQHIITTYDVVSMRGCFCYYCLHTMWNNHPQWHPPKTYSIKSIQLLLCE